MLLYFVAVGTGCKQCLYVLIVVTEHLLEKHAKIMGVFGHLLYRPAYHVSCFIRHYLSLKHWFYQFIIAKVKIIAVCVRKAELNLPACVPDSELIVHILTC